MGWLMCLFLLFFPLHSQLNCASSFSSNSSSTRLCPLDQSIALLQFKKTLSINSSAFEGRCDKSHPKLLSWDEGTDCSSWDGVTCDTVTGHVIGLDLSCSRLLGTIHSNSSLFHLPHLQWLNLAFNDFNGSRISSDFSRLTSLTHLNLSSSVFSGHIPLEISHMSKLVSLDLSDNSNIPTETPLLRLDTLNMKRLVQNLTELRQLNLGGVNMSTVELRSFINLSSSLTSLSLDYCGLHGNFPDYIFRLPNLQKLDLSSNDFYTRYLPKVNWSSPLKFLKLSYLSFLGELPGSIGNLKSLNHLDLSGTSFSGELSGSIGNLKSLNYLDLSGMRFSGRLPSSIGNLQSLNHLDLSRTSFSGEMNFSGELPDSIGNLKSLNYLDLSGTSFSGKLPSSISNLRSLNYLKLAGMNFSGELPVSIGNLQSLNYLDLSSNGFSGSVPAFLGNLTQITDLDLSSNKFTGEIPSTLSNLTRLATLDPSSNQLVGPIPFQIFPNLSSLRLFNNSLNGTIPSWIFTLPSLVLLDLGYNHLTGHIHEFQYNSLQEVYLDSNELHGSLPRSIFQLVNLTLLVLSSNKLSGSVELDKFLMLKNLDILDLSNISLSLTTINHVNSTLPLLSVLGLSSCNLSEFPNFLRTQENLLQLDLSNNKIHGQIPKWARNMGKDSLSYLNLSLNFLTSVEQLPWKNLQYLDLHSNLLEGPLPIPARFMRVFSISDNKLTGEIPSSICNLSSLQILNLSNNSLSGQIPQCLGNFSNNLLVFDLQKNRFHGTIPRMFAKGNSLRSIALNENQLEGSVPQSLVSCRNLEVLNLGNNKMKDTFPFWLQTLPKLQVLVLRSNRFYGPIRGSKVKHPFPNLRILDLSGNDFSGHLPTRYIQNLKAMMNANEAKLEYMGVGTPSFYTKVGANYYQDSMMLTVKGVEIEFVKILTILTTFDLSNNRFQGEIPNSIGMLYSLRSLNFSHNHLTGSIPSSLENLTKLEALDLSWNNISGNIPEQLTSLTFLAFLNLSQNRLVGRIPQGKQFNTFANNSYIGNKELCGVPLSKKCNNDEALQPPPPLIFREDDNHESASGFGWKAVAMGYGCGMVIGLAMGCLLLSTGKLEWLVRLVEEKNLKKARRAYKNARRSVEEGISKFKWPSWGIKLPFNGKDSENTIRWGPEGRKNCP